MKVPRSRATTMRRAVIRVRPLHRSPPDSFRSRTGRVLGRVIAWSGWTKIAAMVTSVAALAALYFSNRALEGTRDQLKLARDTQITDRVTKAVEQLGNQSSPAVRIGGIFALERLSKDSPADRPVIFEVLATFIRMNTHFSHPRNRECVIEPDGSARPIPDDVAAALTVIGRREGDGGEHIDLSYSCLRQAHFERANLTAVDFTFSRLDGAHMDGARFRRTNMSNTHLDGAELYDADLSHETWDGLTMPFARMDRARLDHTRLTNVTLCKSVWYSADLDNAVFERVNLIGATFVAGDDSYPPARNLDRASLPAVAYDDTTRWPPGFHPPPADKTAWPACG
ncbi:MAG: pentapeptide repeat-containing protein [Mycobacteriaceae bacterium]|nr:pentapeptide repeat-containing protein [Mycobacteriaceae bacterium]